MSNQKGEALFPLFMVIAIVSLFGVYIYFSIQEHKEWEAFKVEHECEVVSREKATTGTGIGIMANGQTGMITTTIPPKTGWLCNDGIIYIR